MTQERLKKYWRFILAAVFITCFYTLTWADSVPSIIKIGLESIYKNSSSINISGQTSLSIGHFNENGFMEMGTLPSNQITISSLADEFYDLGNIFGSYQEAVQFAQNYGNGAVPVYLSKNMYKVYFPSDIGGLSLAPRGAKRVGIYDSFGSLLMISEQNDCELVFRGFDSLKNMPLTKVGNTKEYRGAVGIGGTTGITPFNYVNIEEYLYGVVPGEMPSSWPQEALKAQAVAARSIAIYQYNRYASSGYNVVDTTTTQVYGGYKAEKVTTNNAVDSTRGEVIRYNGSVAEALYFSTSGGITEDAKNVWGTDIPYLKAVADTYETEPAQPAWTRSIALSEIDACLAKAGASIGNAIGVQIVSRTPAGRVQEMNILGNSGSYTLTGENVRSFFGSTQEGSLKSRLFSFSGAITNVGSTSNMSSNTLSNAAGNLSIISSSGIQEVSNNGLMVLGSRDMVPLENAFVARTQSGDELVSLTGNSQADSSAGTVLGSNVANETVYGDLIVHGVGFGHGVGMSQSGAKGMANSGFSYDQILKFYYTGVTVE